MHFWTWIIFQFSSVKWSVTMVIVLLGWFWWFFFQITHIKLVQRTLIPGSNFNWHAMACAHHTHQSSCPSTHSCRWTLLCFTSNRHPWHFVSTIFFFAAAVVVVVITPSMFTVVALSSFHLISLTYWNIYSILYWKSLSFMAMNWSSQLIMLTVP